MADKNSQPNIIGFEQFLITWHECDTVCFPKVTSADNVLSESKVSPEIDARGTEWTVSLMVIK